MKRPYMICHILSALDGRISGPFMGTTEGAEMGKAYGDIRNQLAADAWLFGTVTVKEMTGNIKPELERSGNQVALGDFIVKSEEAFYYIAVDAQGEIGWKSGIFHRQGAKPAQVIEILTEQASLEVRAYLQEKQVAYIIAGKTEIDWKLAAEKLYEEFGIRTMLICGGGMINWSFLQAGLLDELSLLIAAAADGAPGKPTVFDKVPFLSVGVPKEFSLKSIERIGENGVWLKYQVKN
ncbi:dihydrofolate reductase family protein [Lachnoclostridium sp. An181]|uniref:dihydrofolate reductase family protein n=1 Tax=Lachnoclostridium sp. An181 TaxID=1965575 RepID=UPI000B3883A1|nr:RibD family protein [Lachnoclostridium sp. An181]OUP49267.1 5-amino-6-(5-phosphoribosylamino)uracil reductase [Lachnoclostridium sp. An181]